MIKRNSLRHKFWKDYFTLTKEVMITIKSVMKEVFWKGLVRDQIVQKFHMKAGRWLYTWCDIILLDKSVDKKETLIFVELTILNKNLTQIIVWSVSFYRLIMTFYRFKKFFSFSPFYAVFFCVSFFLFEVI